MRPRNCVRVMMACITIYNFLIDEGCGYFDEIENLDDFDWDNVDEPGTYDVQDDGALLNEDYSVQNVFCEMLQTAYYNAHVN